MALRDAPVRFEQCRELFVRAADRAVVGNEVDLAEPGHRPCLDATEHALHVAIAERVAVPVHARAGTPTRPHIGGRQAHLALAGSAAGARRAVRGRDLRRPLRQLESELDAVVRRVEVDARALAYERGVVLQAQTERQEELSGLDRELAVLGRQQHIALALDRGARRELLIEVHREQIRDGLELQVHGALRRGRFRPVGPVRQIDVLEAAAVIAADAEPIRYAAVPPRAGLVAQHRVRGELRTREHHAEQVALAATRRVHVALAALEAVLHCEVRLRVGDGNRE